MHKHAEFFTYWQSSMGIFIRTNKLWVFDELLQRELNSFCRAFKTSIGFFFTLYLYIYMYIYVCKFKQVCYVCKLCRGIFYLYI